MQTSLRAAALLAFLATPLPAAPVIGAAKEASTLGREVGIRLHLENLGDVALTSVSVVEDLDATFGAGNYSLVSPPALVAGPGTLTLDPAFDGGADTEIFASGTLAVGATVSVALTVELTTLADVGFGLGVYQNQVTASAVSDDVAMTPTSDLSDAGADPDPSGDGDPTGAGEDDPTVVDVTADPRLGAAKNVLVTGTQMTFELVLENLGNRALGSVSLVDDLDAVFGAGNYAVTGAPAFFDDPGTLVLDPGFDGAATTYLLAGGTLAIGDTAGIRFVVDVTTVTDRGAGLGVYANQAVAAASDGAGNAVTDLSDEGRDPDPDGNGHPRDPDEDDPTIAVVGETASLGVAKTAMVSASTVTIDLYLENLGNVPLSGVSLVDDLRATFGAGDFALAGPPTLVDDPGTLTLDPAYDGGAGTDLFLPAASVLAAGDTARVRVDVTVIALADLGLGFGVYENQAEATARAPGGGLAQDLSDAGTDPDPDGDGDPAEAGEDDPTPISVPVVARIGAAKRMVVDSVVAGTPVVAIRYTLENLGNVTIGSLSMTDDLNAVYGAGNYVHLQDPARISGATTLAYNAAYNGNTNVALLNSAGSSLAPGEQVTFSTRARILSVTDQGSGPGIYQNQVTVNGLDPSANPVSDVSHEGTDPDPDGDDDPSEMDPSLVDVNLVPRLGVALDVAVAGDQVTFDVHLENLGGVALATVALSQSLDAVFGAGNFTLATPPFFVSTPGTLTLEPTYDGTGAGQDLLAAGASSLAPGDTAQIRFVVDVGSVADQGLGLGTYAAQARIQGQTASNVLVEDLSDAGTDPDPDGDGDPAEPGEDDPTIFSVAVDTAVGVAKTASVAGTQVTIDLFLESFGPSTLTAVELVDDLDAAFGAGNHVVIGAPVLVSDPGTLVLNAAYDGAADTAILAPGSTLAPAATAQVRLVVDVVTESDQGNGFGVYANQALAAGRQPSGVRVVDASDDGVDPDPNGNGAPSEAGENDPTVVAISVAPAIGVAKKAFVRGTQVYLDFYVENLGQATLTNVVMRDPLNPVFGSGNYSIAQQPTLLSGPATLLLSPQFFGFNIFDRLILGGSLRPGERVHFRTIVNGNTVTDVGNGFGVYFNGTTITAVDPTGSPVADDSDDGYDPDPDGDGDADETGENDDTRIVIGDECILGAAKTATANDQQVTFDLYVENLAASMLGVDLVEDLDAVFGAGNYSLAGPPALVDDPGTLPLNPTFDGSTDTAVFAPLGTLAAFDTARVRLVVDVTTVTDVGFGFGDYVNQVAVAGTAPLGSSCLDVSDSGTDPDPNGDGTPNEGAEDDPTPFSVGFDAIGVAEDATVAGRQVTLDVYVANLGSTVLPITIEKDLDALFGPGNYALVSGPTIVGELRGFVVNPGYDGSSDTALLVSGDLGLGVTEQIRVVVLVTTPIDSGGGIGVYTDQTVASSSAGASDLSDAGTDPDPNGNGDATEPGENDPTTFTLEGTIGDRVWNDLDGDGVEDGGEPGLAGVLVFLDLDGNGVQGGGEPSDVTDGAGAYDFTVAAGTYTVRVDATTVPAGFVATAGGPFVVVLTAGADHDDADFGYALPDDAIAGAVWHDVDGDGVRDGGEPGVTGVTLDLVDDADGDGTIDGGEAVVASATTAGSGAYAFTSLLPGDYLVLVTDTAGLLAGTTPTNGANPRPVTSPPGGSVAGVDFGFELLAARIGVAKTGSVDGREVRYVFHVENLGTALLTELSLEEDLDAVFGAGGYALVQAPTVVAGAASAPGSPTFDGSSDVELFAAGGQLAAGDFVALEIAVTVDLAPGASATYVNQVSVTARAPDGTLVGDDSRDGSDPDDDGDGNAADETAPTVVVLSPLGGVPAIPTLGSWGLAVLTLGLLALALGRLRRLRPEA